MGYSTKTVAESKRLFPMEQSLHYSIAKCRKDACDILRNMEECSTEIGISAIIECLDRPTIKLRNWGVKTLLAKANRQREILDLLLQMEEEIGYDN